MSCQQRIITPAVFRESIEIDLLFETIDCTICEQELKKKKKKPNFHRQSKQRQHSIFEWLIEKAENEPQVINVESFAVHINYFDSKWIYTNRKWTNSNVMKVYPYCIHMIYLVYNITYIKINLWYIVNIGFIHWNVSACLWRIDELNLIEQWQQYVYISEIVGVYIASLHSIPSCICNCQVHDFIRVVYYFASLQSLGCRNT